MIETAVLLFATFFRIELGALGAVRGRVGGLGAVRGRIGGLPWPSWRAWSCPRRNWGPWSRLGRLGALLYMDLKSAELVFLSLPLFLCLLFKFVFFTQPMIYFYPFKFQTFGRESTIEESFFFSCVNGKRMLWQRNGKKMEKKWEKKWKKSRKKILFSLRVNGS